MKKMFSSVFCLSVLLFIQTTASTKTKVYVIDLTNTDANEDRIELSELFKLLTKSREKPNEAKLDRFIKNESGDENDCLVDAKATKFEKIRCLAKIQRNKLGKSSFNAQRPKRKIYSLYNYYGGKHKALPFTDFTREEFSQDYLDIGDLSRLEKCSQPSCKRSEYHRVLDDFEFNEINKISQDLRRRSNKDSDERASTSSESESSESSLEERSVKTRKRKPSRFQVVFNEDSSLESEEEKPRKPKKSYSSESEKQLSSEEVKKPKKSSDKYAYLQGNRIYDNLRRRLQHFLPKRFHWDEDDMYHNLGYYWFDGPKDKYS